MARFVLLVVLSILLVSALAHNSGKKHIHDKTANLRNQVKQVSGAIECSICSWLVGEVQSYVAENQTENQIITAIDSDCSVFGPLAGLCKTLVGSAVPDIINYLEQNYPPSQICDLIGLCGGSSGTGSSSASSSASTTGPLKRFGKVLKSGPKDPNGPESLECSICEYLVAQVDTYLENNNTIEEIEQFLDNDCQIFGPFSSTCITLVNTYLPDIVNYLEQDYPPSVVCGLIGLCSNSTTGTSTSSSPSSSSSTAPSSTAPSTGTSSSSSFTSSTAPVSRQSKHLASKLGKRLKKAKALRNKIKFAPKKH